MAIGNDSENPIHTIQDASFLLSIVGGANTLSRVVLGYLSDKAWMNRLYLYNGALTVCGLGNLSKKILNIKYLKDLHKQCLEISGEVDARRKFYFSFITKFFSFVFIF